MSDLLIKVRARLEFDERACDKAASEMRKAWLRDQSSTSRSAMDQGARWEHARLKPVHEALLACVAHIQVKHDEDCMDFDEQFKPGETCECGAESSRQALAALAEVVGT